MADILIAAYGSRGDVMPLTDIGCRLVDDGHRVTMTTNPDLVDELTALGLDARPVEFELDADSDPTTEDPMKVAMQMVKPAGMRQLGANLLDAVEDVPADIVLLTPFAELAGHPLAEARNIPSIGLRLQPMSSTSAFPPSLLGAWSGGGFVNRAAGRSAARWFDRLYGNAVAGFRDRLGLPDRSARALRRERTDGNWPILHGFSPTVVPRPTDWRPGLEVVGYWWPRSESGWSPPPELVDFIDAGPPPVYMGFGSLMLPEEAAADLAHTVHETVTRAGIRAVVQSGGTALDIVDDAICSIGAVPHEWLFPRMSVVVHSCGAGTAAAGLRAGIPTIAVPSPGGDQPFWARHLHGLGVAPPAIPRPRLTAEKLAAAVESALTDSAYRTRAGEIAAVIDTDIGACSVVEAVERRLDTART